MITKKEEVGIFNMAFIIKYLSLTIYFGRLICQTLIKIQTVQAVFQNLTIEKLSCRRRKKLVGKLESGF